MQHKYKERITKTLAYIGTIASALYPFSAKGVIDATQRGFIVDGENRDFVVDKRGFLSMPRSKKPDYERAPKTINISRNGNTTTLTSMLGSGPALSRSVTINEGHEGIFEGAEYVDSGIDVKKARQRNPTNYEKPAETPRYSPPITTPISQMAKEAPKQIPTYTRQQMDKSRILGLTAKKETKILPWNAKASQWDAYFQSQGFYFVDQFRQDSGAPPRDANGNITKEIKKPLFEDIKINRDEVYRVLFENDLPSNLDAKSFRYLKEAARVITDGKIDLYAAGGSGNELKVRYRSTLRGKFMGKDDAAALFERAIEMKDRKEYGFFRRGMAKLDDLADRGFGALIEIGQGVANLATLGYVNLH